MYDDVPTDKSAQKLLFPKVERITLFEYDLESCMHQYELREAEKRRVKEEQLEQALKEVKKETSIIKVSSLDNYSGEKRYIKKAKVTSRANRKIRKVKVEKPQYPTREEVSPQPVKNVSMVKRLFKNFVLWLQNIYMKLK
jgi:DNA primase